MADKEILEVLDSSLVLKITFLGYLAEIESRFDRRTLILFTAHAD